MIETTSTAFTTSDADLQRLHERGMEVLRGNLVEFAPGLTVLVEGGGYENAWIETQPMGGEQYACHDLRVALANQRIFMLTQREDGRLAGMVLTGSRVRARGWDANGFPAGYRWWPEHGLVADYEMFQGYCFPEPAWRMYFWIGRDERYLRELYRALEAHDAYLWRTRDSNGDGLLETWCAWDTGEDDSTRLHRRGAPESWPYDVAPGSGHAGLPQLAPDALVPFQSMDVMAYSYGGRAVLAKIAAELGNGEADRWAAAAQEVRRRVIDALWDPVRAACFDRDRHGTVLGELVHNNLRCMWFGMFTQEMADAFIREHLLNPDEFWTPVPLVSIALNEPLFESNPRNNWSGQPQGLTFQRAVTALERYGHVAEVTLIGRKLLPVLVRNGCRFSQQLDHVTGAPSLSNGDGYGPMVFAMQEYLVRACGVHLEVQDGRVWWSGLADGGERFTWRQRWGDREFELVAKDGAFTGAVNGNQVFTSEAGVRVVTDIDGRIVELVGISPEPSAVRVTAHRAGGDREWVGRILPNQVLAPDGDRLALVRAAPFDYPYSAR